MSVDLLPPVVAVSPAGTAVGTTRQVIAGTGMTGGGALSADVTVNLSSSLPNPSGIGVTPSGNGSLQIKAGNQTSTIAKVGGIIFDHFIDAGNVTTGETDLYTDTLPGSMLNANGDKTSAVYAGLFVSSGTATREIRVYFGGTLIFDTGTLSISAGADAWTINVMVVRDTASSVRCSVWANVTGAALNAFDAYTAVSGLTLTNTQIIKITGQAAGVGAATNDIVAKLGSIEWRSAA